MKICSKCKIEKSLDEFGNAKREKDGKKYQCKECSKIYDKYNPEREKAWRLKNRDKLIESKKTYRKNNKDKIKEYIHNNKDKINNRIKDKYRNDEKYRIKRIIRSRIKHAISGNFKSCPSLTLLGCSIDEYKIYLEKYFSPNMSWDNYGEWHIDHIIPCSSFNLTVEEEQKKCFHYSNTRPLWATKEVAIRYGESEDYIGNLEKGNRII